MDNNCTVPYNSSSSEYEGLQRRNRIDSKPHSRARHKGQKRSRLYSSSASSSGSSSSSGSGSRDRARKKRRSSKHGRTHKSKEGTKNRKRKREPSSDSSDSSFSSSSSSSQSDSNSPARKRKKKHPKAKGKHKRKKTSVKHKVKSTHKKEKRHKHKIKDSSKTKKKKGKLKSQKLPDGTEPRVELPSTSTATLPEKETSNQIKGIKAAIAENTGKRRGPMTREEYEKRQSVVKRVFDPDTGRHRLVKGDGEIIEEIVSREQQKAINRQATLGDGASFQAGIAKLL